jgi:hypothetical protein
MLDLVGPGIGDVLGASVYPGGSAQVPVVAEGNHIVVYLVDLNIPCSCIFCDVCFERSDLTLQAVGNDAGAEQKNNGTKRVPNTCTRSGTCSVRCP